jgi:tetraacyldisaccharide 4'-kinase
MNFICIRAINLIWHFLTSCKRSLYRRGVFSVQRLPATCISVGNISSGGTGKSPMVEVVTEILLERGFFPAVLTRGYRSGIGRNSIAIFQNGKLTVQRNIRGNIYPDEARMLSAKLGSVPVVVSPTRYEAAIWYQENSKQKITHWILDDGFQHVQIHRDVDIVLLDAYSMRKQNQIFRESWASLCLANLIIWTRCEENVPSDADDRQLRLYTKQPTLKSFFHMKSPSQIGMKNQRLPSSSKALVFCGIANPKSFFLGLRKMGISVKETYIVSDHQRVTQADLLNRIQHVQAIVTTEKDYYRDPSVFENFPIPVYIVPLSVEIDRESLAAGLMRTPPL